MNTHHKTLPALLRRFVALLGAAAALGAVATGCAPFRMSAPAGMVELDEADWSVYDFRATTPNGVVVATRALRQGEGRDTPEGDLSFWTDAIKLRMRTSAGYALLSEEPWETHDGHEGMRLRFGRDQGTTPYQYEVVLVVTPKWIHLIEVGGTTEQLTELEGTVADALALYEIRR